MDGRGIIIGALFLVASVGMTRSARGLWRPDADRRPMPKSYPFGPNAWRVQNVTALPTLVAVWTIAIESLLFAVNAPLLLTGGLGFVFFGCLIPIASIILFGWPRRLIPPPYRDEADLLHRRHPA